MGCKPEEIYKVSAKTGEGVADVLKAVIKLVPAPKMFSEKKDLRALIFDSIYDEYKGVIAYIRIFEGEIKNGDSIKFVSNKKLANVIEVGYFDPHYVKSGKLETGEIGYVVTGMRDVSQVKVGDTITLENATVELLPGFQEVKPMVFAGVFCKDGSDYSKLREAIEKLKLNDASLMYEPENSKALGFGFRCGFLGLLHLEIFQERLNREFDLDLIVTTPSVAYNVFYKDGSEKMIYNPIEFPDPTFINYVEEPIMRVDIFTPTAYLGGIMQMTTEKRGVYINTEYLDQDVAILHYYVPLTQLIVDFYDKLKSVSSGYASLNYNSHGYQKTEVVKMDILVAEEKIEALSLITYKDSANEVGKRIVNILKNELDRQQFVIKIQAAIGGKIIAAERISALKKDVTAKLYGGDWSRRQKLLEKQKKGKKKMMSLGKVDIPSDAFLAVLKK